MFCCYFVQFAGSVEQNQQRVLAADVICLAGSKCLGRDKG